MTIMHRKTVTLTCDVNGYAEEDLNAYPRSSSLLLTSLHAVLLEGDGGVHLTVREVNVADEDDEDAEETPGTILFYSDREVTNPDVMFYPRVAEVVDQDGVALANEYVPVRITTRQLRVEVDGGALDQEFDVSVFYTSAGDQRF